MKQTFKTNIFRRAALALLLCVLTSMTAWAEAETYTIKLVDNLNWGTAYPYMWGGDKYVWPGTEITQTETNNKGQKVFVISVPYGTEGLIVNNGIGGDNLDQTEDITGITSDMVYYMDGTRDDSGHYLVKSYYNTVTFDSNGGSAVDEQTVGYGSKATEPSPAPTMEGGTFLGWTLNGEDYDFDSEVTSNITLVAKWSVETFYVDENGTSTNVTATTLTGSETELAEGWYVVNSNITYDHALKLGNVTVNIILANGKTMSIGTEASPIEDNGITGAKWSSLPVLHIYGQTTDTDAAGNLEVYSHGINGIDYYTQHSGNVKSHATTAIIANYFTLNGGNFTATAASTGIYSNHDVIINGGQLTATGTGGKIKNGNSSDIILGYTNATDFISFKSIDADGSVKIADGKVMTDGTNTYDSNTSSETLEALTNTKLRPVTYTVSFYINDDDGTNPASQTIAHGMKATAPSVTRTGYTFNGWKNGDADYDFSTPVTDDITLTAQWTANTYTVVFDKNNDDASGTMASVTATYDQWTSIPVCTFTAPEGKALKESGWNTKADGSGDSFWAENGDFRNLTDENGATVTLYAQWGKDIKLCTATVPDQILDGYDYLFYKFEAANYGNATIGEEVMDGEKKLTLGKDYKFGSVIFADGSEGMPSNLGDKCKVEIVGQGDYAGSTWTPFMITTPDDKGEWGDLAWSFHAGKLTINKKDDVEGNVAMEEENEPKNTDYTWFRIANYVKTVTLGEGITSIAEKAFAGTDNVHSYGNLSTLSLPSTLTTIGENAFAFCSSLSINLDAILAKNISLGNHAFYEIGCLTGSLADKADNATKIDLLSQATANVTLSGRTLFKDGNWNTICLPFSLGNSKADEGHYFDGTPFEGATVMELKGADSGFDATSGTLSLVFTDAKSISAGTPYIVKWEGDGTNNLINPVFNGVRVYTDAPTPVKSNDEKVEFVGTYSPAEFTINDKSKLFLSVKDNKSTLFYPNATNFENFPNLTPTATSDYYYLGAFRAYFQLTSGESGPGEVRSFNLNFGDDETPTGILNSQFSIVNSSMSDAWYSLDGRRLNSKPSRAGVYINKGKRVVIK